MFFCVSAASIKNRKKNILALDTSFKGLTVDSDQVEARTFGVNLNFKFDHIFDNNLKSRVEAGLRLDSGGHKSLILDEFKPKEAVVLNNGYLTWQPLTFLELKGGAINQEIHQNPLLLTSTTFPAAIEKLFITFGDYQVYISAQQSIPNNNTLSHRIGKVDEGTPSFFIETAGIKLSGDLASLDASVSHFSYSSLSNGVAFQSAFMGNSTQGSQIEDSEFSYTFQGFSSHLHFNWNLTTTFALILGGNYLINNNAPVGRNSGYITNAGIRIMSTTFSAERFGIESDASPGFYNDKYYGHNNRQGYGGRINVDFTKSNLEIRYIESLSIKNNIYQSDNRIIGFNWTLLHDF